MLNSNTSSICAGNMVNFGLLLMAEICWRVWGTPATFNGFRVLAALLLHGTLVVGVSQTAALNRGRHLYSAGRPSRWALTHILVLSFFPRLISASQIGCLPYFYTWCGLSANLEFRSEMCCTRLTGNAGRENDAKNRHLRTIAQLCRAMSSQLRHVLTIGKKIC